MSFQALQSFSEEDRAGCFTLTRLSLASFCGTLANSENPDQRPQNAASDQVCTVCLQNVLFKID